MRTIGRLAAMLAAGIVCLGWAAAPPAALGAEILVDQKSPVAGDDNPGTPDKPLKTISAAVAKAQAGDTVLIKAGVYREAVNVANSGTADKRLTVKAAPGERVQVNGADVVAGWRKCTQEEARGNPNWQKFYVTELPKGLSTLFQNGRYLKLSRWPFERMLDLEGGTATTIIDSKNLTQAAGFWEGGTLVVRVAAQGNYPRALITKYDPEKHEIVADKPLGGRARTANVVPGKDTYWVENIVTVIDEPGEFAVDARTSPAKVFIWPFGDADPAKSLFETPARSGSFLVTWGSGVAYVTIDGLEAAFGAASAFGGEGRSGGAAHDIEVVNCIGHHCERSGLEASGIRGLTVRHCFFTRNNYGIALRQSTDCLIEESEVLSNREDGIVVSSNSDNIRLVRNLSVDHWFTSHPDSFQIFAFVKNLTLDSNLFFNGGQSAMLEEADGGKFVNNMFIGSRQAGIIFGGSNRPDHGVLNFTLDGNTIMYTALRGISSSGLNMVLKNNIIGGGDGEVTRIMTKDWSSDYNLIYRPEGWKLGTAEGRDVHSKIAMPKFRCAPPEPLGFIIDAWNDQKVAKSTPGKLYLIVTPVKDHFQVGDHVEVNYDGVVRKVTEVTDDYVAFEPPLKMLHEWRWDAIVNWKDRTEFKWDLRLADDSPGKKLGDHGQDVGSTIDVQAYFRGDFNGDGQRDLPAVPQDVLQP